MKASLLVMGLVATPFTIGSTGTADAAYSPPRAATAAAHDTLACQDTLHATDSVNAVFKMTVKTQDPKTSLPPEFEALFVDGIRSRLKVPAILRLSVMQGWAPCDTVAGKCIAGVLAFGSQVYVTAHKDGTLTRIGVIDVSLTPEFSDSVVTAMRRYSSEKLIPAFTRPDSIPLDISIDVEQNPDTVPAFRHLFRVNIPRFNTEFDYSQYPKNGGGPKYPPIAASQGVGDTVKVAFTVLSDGSVESQTVDVLKGRYREFVRAVFDKLATIHYVPARIGACAVAARARQSFVFVAP